MHRYPFRAAAIARPTPVFPEVGSTIVPPGRSFPSRSAASIIASPIRSLFDPPGFMNSSFARIVPGTSRDMRSRRTIGVKPTRSITVGYSRAIRGGSVQRYVTAGITSICIVDSVPLFRPTRTGGRFVTVTDELLANAEGYADTFDRG